MQAFTLRVPQENIHRNDIAYNRNQKLQKTLHKLWSDFRRIMDYLRWLLIRTEWTTDTQKNLLIQQYLNN